MNKENLYGSMIVIVSIILALFFSFSPPGKLIDLKLYDILSMAKPRPKEWNKILYVNIDDQSIDLVGRFPWPRTEIAKGIAVLEEFGADKILLDIEFIDPSLDMINYDYYNQLKEEGNFSKPLANIKDELIIQPDKIMLKAMPQENKNVYLACRGIDETKKKRTVLSEDEFKELSIFLDQFFKPLPDKKLTNYLVTDKYMEIPVFPLYLGAKDVGFTTVDPDIDGSKRKVNLYRIYNEHLIPQLSLPVILDELNVDRDKTVIKPGQYIKFVTKDNKEIKVPVNEKGEMYINWTKKWKEAPFGINGGYIPFSALIEYYNNKKMLSDQMGYLNLPGLSDEDKNNIKGNIVTLQDNIKTLSGKLSVVKGKIIITGETATSSTDIGAITIDPTAPLVLLQGNLINTIYQRAFLQKLPNYIDILAIIILGILIFIISIRLTAALQEIVFAGIVVCAVLAIDYTLLSVFGIILNYILILTHAFISLMAFIIYKFILYDKQKNYIKKAFMQYLSPEVVKQVIANPGLLKLGGEKREITAYFSDVAGFTSISEKLSPEGIVSLLNKYLTAMTDIILENGGTVDKYEGDAIVAFFGAPIPFADHAIRCCNAAVDMQNILITLRQKWTDEGYPPVLVRMGMNTGPAIIGNMGSQQRMDYTMMGDTVNSASRFEGANKAYGTYSMISDSTYIYVKDKFVTRKLDLLRVVGKSTPVGVYELVGRTGEVNDEKISIIKHYHEALEEYTNRNWAKAIKMFGSIVEMYKDPPSATYLDRCQKFKKNPPPEDWDGVFILKSK